MIWLNRLRIRMFLYDPSADDTATCPRCGLRRVDWASDEGRGYQLDEALYCCEGCAEQTGCTCRLIVLREDEDDDEEDEPDEENGVEPGDITIQEMPLARVTRNIPLMTIDLDAVSDDDEEAERRNRASGRPRTRRPPSKFPLRRPAGGDRPRSKRTSPSPRMARLRTALPRGHRGPGAARRARRSRQSGPSRRPRR